MPRRKKTLSKTNRRVAKSRRWPDWLSLIVSLFALVIATSALIVQEWQSRLEEDSAAVETGMTISESWRETFNDENRFRLEIFRDRIERWGKADERERDRSLDTLINKSYCSDAKKIRSDSNVMELLRFELGSESKLGNSSEATDEALVRAAFSFRNTIIDSLNTMEDVKACRDSARSKRTKEIIDKQFREIIKVWTNSLSPFVAEYRKLPGYNGESPPAWDVLTEPWSD